MCARRQRPMILRTLTSLPCHAAALAVLLALFASVSAAQADAKRGEYLAKAAGCVGCHTEEKEGSTAFAGGRTLGMRAADFWLRRRNPAWVGMRSTAELSRCLGDTAQLAVADRDELRAGFWRLQIYRLTKRSTAC